MSTSFKIDAAEFHLERLKNALKGVVRTDSNHEASMRASFEVSVAIDGLLHELMSAIHSLLHDINFGLKLDIPVDKVGLKTIRQKMRRKGFDTADLGDLNNLYHENHWLCDLRKIRNYATHQDLVSRNIEARPEGIKIYLQKPWKRFDVDIIKAAIRAKTEVRDLTEEEVDQVSRNCRTEREVIPYFEFQVRNVKDLVSYIKRRLELRDREISYSAYASYDF